MSVENSNFYIEYLLEMVQLQLQSDIKLQLKACGRYLCQVSFHSHKGVRGFSPTYVELTVPTMFK